MRHRTAIAEHEMPVSSESRLMNIVSSGRFSSPPEIHPVSANPVASELLHDSHSNATYMNAVELQQTVLRAIEQARAAQAKWSLRTVESRLRIIRAIRLEIGRNPRTLAESVGRENLGETLAAEVLPLADACRFLESQASTVLRDRAIGRGGRPVWLWGTKLRLRREPFGIILIIGPSNYPLMIPGIQALQALAAGNVVLLKPGSGGTGAMRALVELAVRNGLPADAFQILPEAPQAASIAIHKGVDKVVLTGSEAAGRSVHRNASDRGIPTIMELSGCDAVFALDDADPELVSDCLMFGLTLNHSRTCIAPRRVFASDMMTSAILARLEKKISERSLLANPEDEPLDPPEMVESHSQISELIHSAISEGARLLTDAIEVVDGRRSLTRIAVLDHVRPEMEIVRVDPYGPVISFLRVSDESQAIAWYGKCPLALGASVFGSSKRCQTIADQIDAGIVVINDLIVATADPRVPFGGRHQSGFGVTRGAAGLEEMTQLKSIVTSRGWFRPHLKAPTPTDADVLEQLIRIEHAANSFAKLKVVPSLLASFLAPTAGSSNSSKVRTQSEFETTTFERIDRPSSSVAPVTRPCSELIDFTCRPVT